MTDTTQAKLTPPGDAPNLPRGLNLASWLLRLAMLSHAIATFASVFTARQTNWGNLLFMRVYQHLDDAHAAAVVTERITVSIYLAAAIVAFFKPWRLLLLGIVGYVLLEVIAGTLMASVRYTEWLASAYALRWGAPLALLVLVSISAKRFRWPPRFATSLSTTILRLCIASVFIAHGWQALMANPPFIDLVLGSAYHLLDIRMAEATAVLILKVIAVVDFCVALGALIYPTPLFVPRRLWASPCRICAIRRVIVPTLMIWLAFWGLVTALSRMTIVGYPAGLSEYVEVLARASHFLGPIALWCVYTATYRPFACQPAKPRETQPCPPQPITTPNPA